MTDQYLFVELNEQKALTLEPDDNDLPRELNDDDGLDPDKPKNNDGEEDAEDSDDDTNKKDDDLDEDDEDDDEEEPPATS